jgi:cyclase
MVEKKIIPCLDVRDGRVVKGVNFVDIRDVGDPVECAREYERQGADELVFLDITATTEGRGTMISVMRKVADAVSIPLAVGGGIRSAEDFRALLDAGASKVGVNSAAVKNPELIREAAETFGSERVVLALDAKLVDGKYNVIVSGGKEDTGIDMIEWAKRAEALGAGEILLTSVDTDGVKGGFDIAMTKAVCEAVNIPVIASGGGGSLASFVEVFEQTGADAALAASVFHFGELTVGDIKSELRAHGISVR